jgi:hypothetical protein
MFNLFLLLITLVPVLHNEVRNVGLKLDDDEIETLPFLLA